MKFRRRTGGKRIHTDRHITHSRVFTHNKRTPEEREREVLVVKVDRPVLKINLATKRRKEKRKIKRKKKKKGNHPSWTSTAEDLK